MRRKLSIFDTLGVCTTDDLVSIRQAWRRKVKILHPDLAKDQEKSVACEALVAVNEAFYALRDHKPFADRRAANRGLDRRKKGNRSWVWTKKERQSVARKDANDRREQQASDAIRTANRPQPKTQEAKNKFFAAQEFAKQAHIARNNAAALAQREEAARAARCAKAAEKLPACSVLKNTDAAGKPQPNMANANQVHETTLAALHGYAVSLNAISAKNRCPKSVCMWR